MTNYEKEIKILLEFENAKHGEKAELLKRHNMHRVSLYRLRKKYESIDFKTLSLAKDIESIVNRLHQEAGDSTRLEAVPQRVGITFELTSSK